MELKHTMEKERQVDLVRKVGGRQLGPSPLSVRDPLSESVRSHRQSPLVIFGGLVLGITFVAAAVFMIVRGLETNQPLNAGQAPTLPPATIERAILELSVQPEAAHVRINGRAVSLEDGEPLELAAGSYLVSARLGGYESVDTLVSLRPGASAELALSLREGSSGIDDVLHEAPDRETLSIAEAPEARDPQPVVSGPAEASATVSVTSTVQRARVYVNGELVGTTPLSDFAVPAGEVSIRIDAEGHEPQERQISPIPGQHINVTSELVPHEGSVRVLVLPWGSIFVDGQLMHEATDLRRQYDVPVGTRRIRAEHPSLGEIEKDVQVERGLVVDVVLNFNEP
jgi:hypothetical protein